MATYGVRKAAQSSYARTDMSPGASRRPGDPERALADAFGQIFARAVLKQAV